MTLLSVAVVEEGPGDAPLIVLVHGSMDRMAGFAKVARRLIGEFRVVRYDRRGYGESVRHPGPFAIPDHASDLLSILGGRRAVLIGHSMGGNVVLSVAQQHPELVASAAVYETPLTWMPWWPQNSTSRTVGNAGEDPGDVAEAFMRGMIGNSRWERLPDATRQARRSEGRVLIGEMVSVREVAPWVGTEIEVPVVVGRGSEARPHHFEGMVRLAESIPEGHLVTLDGCHHVAHSAAPDQFVEEVIRPALKRARW